MLQIISGKYFKTTELTKTVHRGVFYTNMNLWSREPLQTKVGSLLRSVTSSGPRIVNYEIIEQLEDIREPGMIAATNGSDLVNDFSAVVSFALGVICTSDAELARRLVIDDRPPLGVSRVPRYFTPRIFDKEIQVTDADTETLTVFVDKLIALRRRDFVGVMNAVRQFVIATHRLSDDPSLAYTLFVASIESLAQQFDGHLLSWTEYEDSKRTKIDEALAGVAPEAADQVRRTLIELEHGTLRIRFRNFVIAHLKPSFFREEAAKLSAPVSRSQIPRVLDAAYVMRSKYVHTLRPVPGNVMMGQEFEVSNDGSGPMLTFAGLVRLCRHVIFSFLDSLEPGDDPDFQYRSALPGRVTMMMATQHWVFAADGLTVASARRYFAGHISEIGTILSSPPGVALTDLSAVLEKIETLVPGLAKPSQRIPLVALYASFHFQISEKHRRPNWVKLYDRYKQDLEIPSIESLIVHLLLGSPPPWDIDIIEDLRVEYFQFKYAKSGMDVGPVIETMISLWLAEQRRQSGQFDAARSLISFSVENYPTSHALRDFEASLGKNIPAIDWHDLIATKAVPALANTDQPK